MKDLLNYLIKEITGKESFEISENQENDKVIFTVTADAEDMGLIIGKEGKTIKAIQDIMRIRGKLEKVAVFVDVSTKEA